ncbi:MAG: nickel-responsive transcriptional regulator NikR [Myxococcales bacterium]|nr:MAG: nickel-responsive transcriptional regulator NikR [Myxococcales bacterium]
MSKLTRISISLEEDLQKQFDQVVEEEGYPTRSEAIKSLIRQRLVQREWIKGNLVAGAITMVFDHHVHEVANKLLSVQHDFVDVIVSTQHVHLDHHNCMETIIVKGKPRRIQRLVSELKSIKGLKHQSLVMTTTGKDIA